MKGYSGPGAEQLAQDAVQRMIGVRMGISVDDNDSLESPRETSSSNVEHHTWKHSPITSRTIPSKQRKERGMMSTRHKPK